MAVWFKVYALFFATASAASINTTLFLKWSEEAQN